MGNDVFVNGREVSCKAADGKAICAFPDVCFTPPQTPATPPGVPIPYPNTGMASDATSGSKNVKISGKEVMLKNKSYFKKSMGNEAGCAPKKGFVTSKIQGKVYFNAWSMDVKFEGENVVRHLDLTTHNHASPLGQTPPWPYVDSMAFKNTLGCEEEERKAKRACQGQTTNKCSPVCKKAQKCILVPKRDDKKRCCKPHTTGHHMIEDHWVTKSDGSALFDFGGKENLYNGAPTVCANRIRKKGTIHRRLHDLQGTFEESFMPGGARHNEKLPNGGWNYRAGKKAAMIAHAEVFADAGCQSKCLESQLDNFYGKNNDKPLAKPTKQALGKRRDVLKKSHGSPREFTLA